MEFKILGPLEVVRDGTPVDLGGAKQRSVLVALLLNAGRVVPAERLADEVWDGAPPPAAATTLRSYLSNLRKALEPDRVGDPQLLRTKGGGYVLDVPEGSIDAASFEELATCGRDAMAAGDHELASELIERGLELWRGGVLEGFTDLSCVRAEAARLEELRIAGIEDLIEAKLALGRHAELTAQLEVLTAQHPFRERLWAARMLALYRSGRQGEALKAYEEARSTLADELGVEPSPELREVHASIVRQEDSTVRTVPAGGKHVITFLFTDVELSTERLLRAKDEYEYAAVLERHRDALRDAFAAHGGRRVRTWGDAFFAAFDSATDAVRAAVDSQLALLTEGPQTEVRVRMGIHTGETTFITDDYVGIAIHAAARVQAAAHGGQVIITQSTKELLEQEVAPGVSFIDLGQHHLKDIPEPLRLYQLAHPELPRTFPPPRSMSALPHNLPAQRTSFIGRTEDVAEIVGELRNGRLVTLTGVGGVGKTRLAGKIGSDVLTSYPDGVWLVELAAITEPDGIVHAVSHALGVQGLPGLSVRESLLAALAQRHTLVILDNCEHMIGPVADLVDEIMRRCTEVTVLATSREALGVDGERIRPIRSLRLPTEGDDEASVDDIEAVRLFVDRARGVRPDFELGPHNAAAVAQICRRLDGIPLAIELAAARVASMGPLEIAARLDQRFKFLRSGRRTAVERHRTLQAAVDWSYALLSGQEQLLFERLSVFAGGFTLEAAEQICGGLAEVDVGDALDGLVAKSITVADLTASQTRYSLLETLRQYGEDKLEERAELGQLREAHAAYFARFLEDTHDAAWLGNDAFYADLVDREQDNVRAAFSWATATGNTDLALRMIASFYEMGLLWSNVTDWASTAASMPDARDHRRFPVVAGIAASIKWATGDYSAALDLAERGLAAAPDRGDYRRIAPLVAYLSVKMVQGELEDARRAVAEAIGLARDRNYPAEVALWLSRASVVDTYSGEAEKGLRRAEEAHSLATSVDHSTATGLALYAIGEATSDSDPERALAAFEGCISLAKMCRYPFLLGIAAISFSSLKARLGEPVDALRSFLEVIEDWRRAANWTQQWNALRNLVELFARLGLDEAAVTLLSAADASPTAPPVFGAHGERLEKLVEALGERLGAQGFDVAQARGRSMSGEEAVAFATQEIRRSLDELGPAASVEKGSVV